MGTTTSSAATTIAAEPSRVFAAITDVQGLPAWNARMTSVIEAPADLTPGVEWVVELKALGQTWHSRSTLEEIDPAARRFAYRSGTDDGNPSRALWTWEVTDDREGSRVTVRWELRPVTFWRRVLLARIRARQLVGEVRASLAALGRRVESSSSPSTTSI